MGTFFISADLAQVNDYTAITIFEIVKKKEKNAEKEYHLRHIERPERGTSYNKIVERLKEIVEVGPLAKVPRGNKTVVIDISGVG